MKECSYQDRLYYPEDFSGDIGEMERQIRVLLRENHGVGILGGYYRPGLPLCLVSELTIELLGYDSAEEFEQATGNCMAGLVQDAQYSEEEFTGRPGVFILHLRGKSGPLWARLVKSGTAVDPGDGQRIWLASVCDMDALYRKERQFDRFLTENREKEQARQAELQRQKTDLEHALEEARRNNEVVSALGRIYWQIYSLDLQTGLFEGISAHDELYRLTGERGVTAERFPAACRATVREEDQPEMLAFLDTATLADRLSGRDEISREFQTVTGNWHRGRFIVQRRDEQGRAIRVLYTFQNITEQKRRELEYERRLAGIAEEAQRANLSKSDFLRRISHDIRTPINGLRGMIEIANHCADDPQKQKECRDKMWEVSGYLLMLVNSVLDMNKLESGAVVLEEVPFDLEQLLKESNAVAEVQAAERALHYCVDWDRRSLRHTRLIGSPAHIKQILMNVAGNAVKYNRKGGSIRVWCEELSDNGEQAVFRFTCADTGIGMSRDFQKHVFEPFSQEGRNDARTRYDGSGLGLSIVKALTEQMGGSVDFVSEEGVGTTFFVTLPLRIDPAPPVQPEEPEAPADLSGVRVLLAEDNDINREIAEFCLVHAGASITAARNGQEAVEQFRAAPPGTYDLILMDVMMPVMNGHEAARAIRAMDRPDAASIPILAMSANAFQDDILRSKAAGMNDHLPKPLDMSTLVAAVCRAVGRRDRGGAASPSGADPQ